MTMKSMFIIIVVSISIMAISVTDAQNAVGIVHVNGTLYCSSNGSNSGGIGIPPPVFPGAVVQVACSADVIANAPVNATSNSNGVYLVVLIPRPNATVVSIVSSCRLFVLTPLSTCNPVLPSAGLVSNLRFVKTVPVGFWYLTYLVASGFTLQA